MNKQELLDKIASRDLVCGTVGLGYVGLPLAVEKAKAGFKTVGIDVQAEKVDMVNRGENYIGDVVNEDLQQLRLTCTSSPTPHIWSLPPRLLRPTSKRV